MRVKKYENFQRLAYLVCETNLRVESTKNILVFRRLLSLSTPTQKLEIVNGCMVNLGSMSIVFPDFTSMESVVQEVAMTVDS